MSARFYEGKPIIQFDSQVMQMIKMMRDTLPSLLMGMAESCIRNNAVIDAMRFCQGAEINETELKETLDILESQYGIKSSIIKTKEVHLIEFSK